MSDIISVIATCICQQKNHDKMMQFNSNVHATHYTLRHFRVYNQILRIKLVQNHCMVAYFPCS